MAALKQLTSVVSDTSGCCGKQVLQTIIGNYKRNEGRPGPADARSFRDWQGLCPRDSPATGQGIDLYEDT